MNWVRPQTPNPHTLQIKSIKNAFLECFPMNLIGLPAEGGKCGSLLLDGVGEDGRLWDSRQIEGFTLQRMMLNTCEIGLIVFNPQMFYQHTVPKPNSTRTFRN